MRFNNIMDLVVYDIMHYYAFIFVILEDIFNIKKYNFFSHNIKMSGPKEI